MTTLPLSARPGAVGAWVLAARPKTLSAAVVPVVVGTAVAHATGGVRVGPALAALLGALLLQIAANFANDVFDYEKGADTDERLGPTRAVASGLIPPARMRAALLKRQHKRNHKLKTCSRFIHSKHSALTMDLEYD